MFISMMKMHYLMLIQTIYGINGFYFYMSHSELHEGLTFNEIQQNFLQMIYYSLSLGRSDSNYIRSKMDITMMISYALFTITTIIYVYYYGIEIYKKLKSQ